MISKIPEMAVKLWERFDLIDIDGHNSQEYTYLLIIISILHGLKVIIHTIIPVTYQQIYMDEVFVKITS